MNRAIENKINTYRMSNLTEDGTIRTTDNSQLSANATTSNQIDDSNLRVEIVDRQTRQPTRQEDGEPVSDEAEEEHVIGFNTISGKIIISKITLSSFNYYLKIN
jgi:hypothetical protein